MNYFNVTPHAIRVRVEESQVCEPLESDIVIEPSGIVTRVDYPPIPCALEGFKMFEFPGALMDMVSRETNAVVIMSTPAAQALAVSNPGYFTNGGIACSPGESIRYPKGHPQSGQVFAVRNFSIWR